MRTRFTAEQLADPEIAASHGAIRKCVHCGFCTATCPTYVLLGDERDSPRGRIELIRDMLERGGPPPAATVTHVDRCLSCLACTTTCPSGVDYAQLIGHARAHIEAHHVRPWPERVLRGVLARVLTRPALLRFALGLGRLAKPLEPLLVRLRLRPLAAMLALLPAKSDFSLPFNGEGDSPFGERGGVVSQGGWSSGVGAASPPPRSLLASRPPHKGGG